MVDIKLYARPANLLRVLATGSSSSTGLGLDVKVDKEQTRQESSEEDGKVGSELHLKGNGVGGKDLNDGVHSHGRDRKSLNGSGLGSGKSSWKRLHHAVLDLIIWSHLSDGKLSFEGASRSRLSLSSEFVVSLTLGSLLRHEGQSTGHDGEEDGDDGLHGGDVLDTEKICTPERTNVTSRWLWYLSYQLKSSDPMVSTSGSPQKILASALHLLHSHLCIVAYTVSR